MPAESQFHPQVVLNASGQGAHLVIPRKPAQRASSKEGDRQIVDAEILARHTILLKEVVEHLQILDGFRTVVGAPLERGGFEQAKGVHQPAVFGVAEEVIERVR